MVQPLTKPKIVKKRTKPFKRHQCDRRITVKVWTNINNLQIVRFLVNVSCKLLLPHSGVMEAPKGY